MNEIYWITRLNAIDSILTTLTFITLAITVAFAIVSIVCNDLFVSGCDKYKEYNKKWRKIGFRTSITSSIVCLFFALATTLTPDTKEATIIYGVGVTFDYLKQNDTAKQLPEKALKAIDSWIGYVTVDSDSTKVKDMENTVNENDSIK